MYHVFCALMNPPATPKRYDAIQVRFKHQRLCVNFVSRNTCSKVFIFSVSLCSQERIPSRHLPGRGGHTTTHHAHAPCQRRRKRRYVLIWTERAASVCHFKCILHVVAIVQALSPVRFDQAPSSPLSTRHQESQKLHESQKSCSGVTDEQPVFTESWPASTDCESSPTSCTSLDNVESMAHKVTSGKTGIFSERGTWRESDLTKCV